MNRLVNTRLTVFAILTMMMAIKGVPLNDTASDLHNKTISISAVEATTTVNDPFLENLEPPDAFKNATKTRKIFMQADEEQLEHETGQIHRYLVGLGYCLNSASMANLFNNAA